MTVLPPLPIRNNLESMLRKFVIATAVVLIGVLLFVLLAPLAPEGTWLNNAGEGMADAFKTWWENPFGS